MENFKSFLAVVLSIVLCFLLVIIVLLFNVRLFVSKESISKSIKNASLVKEVQKVRNSGSMENQSKVTKSINEIYNVALEYGVSETIVNEIINSNTTKQIVIDSISSLFSYIINGEEVPSLTSEETYNIISDNLDNWLDEAVIDISDIQKEKFLNRLKLEIPDFLDTINLNGYAVRDKYSDEVKVIRFIFSDGVKWGLILVSLIISIVIVILKKMKSLVYFGGSILVCGLVITFISILIPEVVVRLSSITDLSIFAGFLTNAFSERLMISGITMVVISILLLFIYIFGYRKVKNS